MPRNSPSFSSTWPHRSSRSNTSRFAIAIAADTGWPPKVMPCVKAFLPVMKGSATRSGDHGAHRGVRRGEPLRGRDDVRHHVEALDTEVVAEPAPGADDLVGDQEHLVLVADLAHALPVAVLRHEAAARVLHGLEDHSGHRLGA